MWSRLTVTVIVWMMYVAACGCVVFPNVDLSAYPFPLKPLSGPMYGIHLLAMGWFPPLTIPWFANVLLLVGWVLLLTRENIAAVVVGFLAAGLGLSIWGFLNVGSGLHLALGYYLWQGSLLALALGASGITIFERHSGVFWRRQPIG